MDKFDFIVGVDHIGYAVKDMAAAKRCFTDLGYEFSDCTVDELQKVTVVVARSGGVRIELLAPFGGVRSPMTDTSKR